MGWRLIDESDSNRSRRYQAPVEWTLIETTDETWYNGTLQWSLEGKTIAGLLTAQLGSNQWTYDKPLTASMAIIDGNNTWHVIGTFCHIKTPG
jgi:hypothetical protein